MVRRLAKPTHDVAVRSAAHTERPCATCPLPVCRRKLRQKPTGDCNAITGATRHSLWLDLAGGRAASEVDGNGIGAGNARHGSAVPVNGAPPLAALGPG